MLFKFHLIESPMPIFDDEGVDLPDIEAARKQALKSIRDILAEDVKTGGRIDLNRSIEVTSQDGTLLFCVPFTDGVTVGHA